MFFSEGISHRHLPKIILDLVEVSDSILEIGCGIGDQTQYTRSAARVVCVEPHEPYLERARERAPWANFINTDGTDFFSTSNEKFDSVLLIDVIEHLERDAAKELVARAIQAANKYVMAFIPYGVHQQDGDAWNMGGEHWQLHRTTWYESDVRSLNFTYYTVWQNFFGHWDQDTNKTPDAFFAMWIADAETGPKFSILIPSYNQAEFLPDAARSLSNQSYPDFEAIIVDDGSTDATEQVAKVITEQDSRFKYFKKQNGGCASALNHALDQAGNEWIGWLSSDDLFEPDKLETHAVAIRNYPEIKFFYTHFYYMNETTRQKTSPDFSFDLPGPEYRVSRMFLGNFVHGNSIAVHSSVFEKIGKFDQSMRYAQDFDMWLRIQALFPSHFIEARTCITRWHEGQTTNSFPQAGLFDSARSCRNFLNTHTFKEVFPWSDLTDPTQALAAVREAVRISLSPKAIMYSTGYVPLLLERAAEWLSRDATKEVRATILADLEAELPPIDSMPIPATIKKALEALVQGEKGAFEFKEHDYLIELASMIDELTSEGMADAASTFRRYKELVEAAK